MKEYKLIKERKIYNFNHFDSFEKHYDENGKLIYDSLKGESYHRNDEGKVIKIINEYVGDYGIQGQVKEKKINYDKNGYSAILSRTQIIDDSYTNKELGNSLTEDEYSKLYYKDSHRILEIEEFEKFENKTIKKHTDLINNIIETEECTYNEEKLLSKQIEVIKDGKVSAISEYIYENELVVLIDYFSFHNEIKYLASKTEYVYDNQNNLIEENTYDRFNSKLYQTHKKRITYSGNTIYEQEIIDSDFNIFGHYDYDSIIPGEGVMGEALDIPSIEEFEKRDFSFDNKNIYRYISKLKKLDNKGNVIELYETHQGETERYIYINDYLEGERLNKVTCINVFEDYFEVEFEHFFYYKNIGTE